MYPKVKLAIGFFAKNFKSNSLQLIKSEVMNYNILNHCFYFLCKYYY